MPLIPKSFAASAALVALTLMSCAGQKALVSGKETRINTRLLGAQQQPAVDLTPDRGVLVWSSSDGLQQQPEENGIYGQMLNAEGMPEGPDFLISETQKGSFSDPAVAMNAAGEYIVVWSAVLQNRPQSDKSWGIYARLYNSDGKPRGAAFAVNAPTRVSQESPDVGIDQEGNFTVVWSAYGDGDGAGIYAQRYDSSAFTRGEAFVINTETRGNQTKPSLSMTPTGESVVVWECEIPNGDREEICGQRYAAKGEPVGTQFQINVHTQDSQSDPAVTMNAAGDFAVAWSSEGQTKGADIYAQKYSAQGQALASPFLVNTFIESNQLTPDIAIDEAGNFTVVWASFRQGSYYSYLYGQSFDTEGKPIAKELMINDEEKGFSHAGPAIAVNPSGEYIVVWESDHQPGKRQNPNRADVYLKTYTKAK